MLQYTPTQIAQMCGATTHSIVAPNDIIQYIAFDSRQLTFADNTLFVCLQSSRNDGHRYIEPLSRMGVRNFLVSEDYTGTPKNVNLYYVQHTLKALQHLAAAHRQGFNARVIAITGSNGKTIIKEWLSRALSTKYNVAKSPKSYNSQLGVPLSVLELEQRHEVALFEAGISKSGEMEALEAIIKPEIGILTNIGSAHDEGFSSRTEKLAEKLLLFKNAHTLIFNNLGDAVSEQVFAFCNAHQIKALSWYWEGEYWRSGEYSLPFYLPFTDPASMQNAGHCIATMLLMQMTHSEMQKQVAGFKNIPMRLMLKPGIQGAYLIDDTYNNDLSGLKIALQFMDMQHKPALKGRTVICSDMEETGLPTDELYRRIAQLLSVFGVSRFIGVGISEHLQQYLDEDIESRFFDDTADFINHIRNLDFSGNLVLIKGARKFGFEKIVHFLEQKLHSTRLEVNLEHLAHNLHYYKSLAGAGVKCMAMVKAMSYGAGVDEIARVLQFHGVDYLAVAYTDEGVRLRESGIHLPIMVMSPQEEDFEHLLQHHLEPEIYSFRLLQQFERFLQLRYPGRSDIKVHIKLDTGMKRLGFVTADLPDLMASLTSNTQITVASIFSHLAGSEAAEHDDFSAKQIALFDEMSTSLSHALGYRPLRHILNSAGIVRHPNGRFDMVRLGLGLYGVDTTNDAPNQKLKLVGALKTVVLQVKQVSAAESIGYGRTQTLAEDGSIATIAIGYSDGFHRRLSNGVGKVKIRGKWYQTVGRVCMDMTMINVTGSDVQEGDEVVIFDDVASLNELAKALGTIPYEVLTSIGERVKRVFFWE